MQSQPSDNFRLDVPTVEWLSAKRPYCFSNFSQSGGSSVEGTPKRHCTPENKFCSHLPSSVERNDESERVTFRDSSRTQLPSIASSDSKLTYRPFDTTDTIGTAFESSNEFKTNTHAAHIPGQEPAFVAPWDSSQAQHCTMWNESHSVRHLGPDPDVPLASEDCLIEENSYDQKMQWQPSFDEFFHIQSQFDDDTGDNITASEHQRSLLDDDWEISKASDFSPPSASCSRDLSSINYATPYSSHEEYERAGATCDSSAPGLDADNPGILTQEAPSTTTHHDTCLGLLLIEDILLHREVCDSKGKMFKIDVCGDMVVMRDQESNSYEGLVGQKTADVIRNLVMKHDIKLQGSIKAPSKLELLLYSRHEDVNEIGEFLSSHDCFIQPPNSYDLSTSYHNPHWLLRPGTEVVPLYHNNTGTAQAPSLTMNEKSRVTDILDSAIGPVDFRDAEVSGLLTTELKKHQAKALSMMLEKESGLLEGAKFPSLWVDVSDTQMGATRYLNTITKRRVARRPQICLGGLLADDMGLGKTLTSLALVAGSLRPDNSGILAAPGPTLIVTPLSTLPGWEHQLEMYICQSRTSLTSAHMHARHFKGGEIQSIIYHGATRRKDVARLREYHIVLTTYDIVRAEWMTALKSKNKADQNGSLHYFQWHRVILDEAHVIRNRQSKTFSAVRDIKARHRWCLTGTPIQNSLEDLGALVEFLRVYPFDNPNSFRDHFIKSNESRERLRSFIQCIAIRRTKESLEEEINIPPRHDIIQSVHLDPSERQIYDLVKRHFALAIDSGGSMMNALSLILRLRQICDHGKALLPRSLQNWLEKAALFDDTALPLLQDCEICSGNVSDILPCLHQVCKDCIVWDSKETEQRRRMCPLCDESLSEMIRPSHTVLDSESSSCYRPSAKVRALIHNLTRDSKESSSLGHSPPKSVVFSQWTSMLDLIGKALESNGIVHQRLDGSRSLQQRRQTLVEFRTNPCCQVLLATLGSAGVGLDLTIASRVHMIEPGWNPMLERQALDRVHRLGQTKEVVSVSYVTAGRDSVEAYIRTKQKWKVEMIAASLGSGDIKGHPNVDTLLKVSFQPFSPLSRHADSEAEDI